MCSIGFASCTFLGAKYGIGKKLAYFLLFHPDYFSKALFVWPLGPFVFLQLPQANYMNEKNSTSGWVNCSTLL